MVYSELLGIHLGRFRDTIVTFVTSVIYVKGYSNISSKI